jgi:hypothetical protein
MVTTFNWTAQIEAEPLATVTASPEVAVGLRVIDASPQVLVAGPVNEMV